MWDDYDYLDAFEDNDSIFDYDFSMGGGDPGFFDYNINTDWMDSFDWGSAIDSLDFSNLALPDFAAQLSDTAITPDTEKGLGYLLSGSMPKLSTIDRMPASSSVFPLVPEGSELPGQGFSSGLDLEVPEVPGMSYTGGAQGLRVDTPEGPLTQFGQLSSEATPALGDLSSFINDPTDLGRDIFTTDFYRPSSGAATMVDPRTGETRKISQADAEKIQSNAGKSPIEKAMREIKDRLTGKGGGKSGIDPMLAALLGGLLGLLNRPTGAKPVGYQGGIPKYTATRGTPSTPTAGGRLPGGAGIPSLTGGVTFQRAAAGGLMGLAAGGKPNPPRYLRGRTDGMKDEIYTNIDGKQPARLSHGEFVVPADVVSHLGNGNSDAGAKELHNMMDRVRKARTGTKKQGKQINPHAKLPA